MSAPLDRESLRVLLELLDLEPSRRWVELHGRYGHDSALVAAVEALLAHQTETGDEPAVLPETEAEEGGSPGPLLPATEAEPAELADDYPPGALIGPYRIERIIGHGGMGVVYLAREEEVRRQVALKVVRGPISERARRRFLAERQVLADLAHPNIVPLYSAGTTERGEPYFVMQYVQGETLAARRAALRPSPRDCARLLLPIADAVAYAHDQGVVHRDLKPANILLDRTVGPTGEAGGEAVSAEDAPGRPMVADFGLAHSVRDPRPATATHLDRLSGTPGYMAPEQILGGPGRKNEAVDIYALGALLYFLLTGHDPHAAATPLATCTLALREAPAPIRRSRADVPGDLKAIVEKAMEREPSRRFGTARLMAENLQRFLDGRPLTFRRTSPAEQAARWVWHHRIGAVAWAVSVLAILIGSLVVLAGKNRELSATNRKLEEKANEARRTSEFVARIFVRYAANVEKVANRMGTSDPWFDDLSAGLVESIDEVADQWGGSELPLELAYVRGLAHFQVARSDVNHRRFEPMLRNYQAAVDSLRPLADRHPDRADIRYDLFRALSGFGSQQARTDPSRGLALHEEALVVIASLAASSGDPDYRDAEANQRLMLGGRLFAAGKRHEGEAMLRQAAATAEALASAPGARPRYWRNVALASGSLAYHLHGLGELDRAEAECRRAIEAETIALGSAPDDPEYLGEQASWLQLLARLRVDRGDVPGAEAPLDEASRLRGRCLDRRPQSIDYLANVINARVERAAVKRASGKSTEAERDIEAVRPLLDRLAKLLPPGDDGLLATIGGASILDPALGHRVAPIAASRSTAGLEDPWSRVALARAWLASGDHGRALELVTTDLPAGQRRFPAFPLLAAIAEARLGRTAEARARLDVDLVTLDNFHQACLLLRCLRLDAEELVRKAGR